MRFSKSFIFKIILFLLLPISVFADVPCNYRTSDMVIYEGRIESVKIEKKNVFPYIEDTRKCSITLQARIKDTWYPSTAYYIFGPDMSEMDACNIAENRAKIEIMQKIIPETLKGEKNLECDLTNVKYSCKLVYINAYMHNIGEQKIKMEVCE